MNEVQLYSIMFWFVDHLRLDKFYQLITMNFVQKPLLANAMIKSLNFLVIYV